MKTLTESQQNEMNELHQLHEWLEAQKKEVSERMKKFIEDTSKANNKELKPINRLRNNDNNKIKPLEMLRYGKNRIKPYNASIYSTHMAYSQTFKYDLNKYKFAQYYIDGNDIYVNFNNNDGYAMTHSRSIYSNAATSIIKILKQQGHKPKIRINLEKVIIDGITYFKLIIVESK